MDWYEEYIEESIRPLVRLLRDNGFNTQCSCGHEMYVECSCLLDGEIQRLHNLLFNNGHSDYEINVNIKVLNQCLYSVCTIKLAIKA